MLEVYPIDSIVAIDVDMGKSDAVQGKIISVCLRGSPAKPCVCYCVEWWDGRKIECREFDAFRVTPGQKGVTPINVGFCK
jgi:hypothetical protein